MKKPKHKKVKAGISLNSRGKKILASISNRDSNTTAEKNKSLLQSSSYRCQSMLVINAPLAGKLLQDYYYQHAEHASRNLHLVLVEESSVCLFD